MTADLDPIPVSIVQITDRGGRVHVRLDNGFGFTTSGRSFATFNAISSLIGGMTDDRTGAPLQLRGRDRFQHDPAAWKAHVDGLTDWPAAGPGSRGGLIAAMRRFFGRLVPHRLKNFTGPSRRFDRARVAALRARRAHTTF